jgi:DNA-binding CsgD family transcriptional regulator
MSLHLTASDVARCEAVSRTLLSPLSAPSVDEWRREVNRTLRDLFRVDHVVFGLGHSGDYFLCDDMDRGTMQSFTRLVLEASTAPKGKSPDPYLTTLFEQRQRRGIRVYDTHMADEMVGTSHRRSTLYNEVFVPYRLNNFLAVNTLVPHGEARLGLGYRHDSPEPFADSAVMLLTAFVPALKAGVEALTRLDAHRTALDNLHEPLLIVDENGRELHRNRTLTRLLDPDAERERVLGEARFLARRLGTLGFPVPGFQNQTPFAPGIREVHTQHGHYRLRGTVVAPGLFAASGVVMIAVETRQAAPALPPPETLRARYGLTRREAEVALLLAEGLSNDEIADRLFISTHTARHHTENVLAKLALPSRKGLALKLMQP